MKTYFKSFHEVVDDRLFDDYHIEGVWHRLMTVADRMYPNAGVVSRSIPPDALESLVEAGRVVLHGSDTYRMPELDEERAETSAQAARAANARWKPETSNEAAATNADALPTRRDSPIPDQKEIRPAVDLQRAPAREAESFRSERDARSPSRPVRATSRRQQTGRQDMPQSRYPLTPAGAAEREADLEAERLDALLSYRTQD